MSSDIETVAQRTDVVVTWIYRTFKQSLQESGLMIVAGENGELSLEQSDEAPLANGPITTGAVLLSSEALNILNKGREGSLGTHSLASSTASHNSHPVASTTPSTPASEPGVQGPNPDSVVSGPNTVTHSVDDAVDGSSVDGPLNKDSSVDSVQGSPACLAGERGVDDDVETVCVLSDQPDAAVSHSPSNQNSQNSSQEPEAHSSVSDEKEPTPSLSKNVHSESSCQEKPSVSSVTSHEERESESTEESTSDGMFTPLHDQENGHCTDNRWKTLDKDDVPKENNEEDSSDKTGQTDSTPGSPSAQLTDVTESGPLGNMSDLPSVVITECSLSQRVKSEDSEDDGDEFFDAVSTPVPGAEEKTYDFGKEVDGNAESPEVEKEGVGSASSVEDGSSVDATAGYVKENDQEACVVEGKSSVSVSVDEGSEYDANDVTMQSVENAGACVGGGLVSASSNMETESEKVADGSAAVCAKESTGEAVVCVTVDERIDGAVKEVCEDTNTNGDKNTEENVGELCTEDESFRDAPEALEEDDGTAKDLTPVVDDIAASPEKQDLSANETKDKVVDAPPDQKGEAEADSEDEQHSGEPLTKQDSTAVTSVSEAELNKCDATSEAGEAESSSSAGAVVDVCAQSEDDPSKAPAGDEVQQTQESQGDEITMEKSTAELSETEQTDVNEEVNSEEVGENIDKSGITESIVPDSPEESVCESACSDKPKDKQDADGTEVCSSLQGSETRNTEADTEESGDSEGTDTRDPEDSIEEPPTGDAKDVKGEDEDVEDVASNIASNRNGAGESTVDSSDTKDTEDVGGSTESDAKDTEGRREDIKSGHTATKDTEGRGEDSESHSTTVTQTEERGEKSESDGATAKDSEDGGEDTESGSGVVEQTEDRGKKSKFTAKDSEDGGEDTESGSAAVEQTEDRGEKSESDDAMIKDTEDGREDIESDSTALKQTEDRGDKNESGDSAVKETGDSGENIESKSQDAELREETSGSGSGAAKETEQGRDDIGESESIAATGTEDGGENIESNSIAATVTEQSRKEVEESESTAVKDTEKTREEIGSGATATKVTEDGGEDAKETSDSAASTATVDVLKTTEESNSAKSTDGVGKDMEEDSCSGKAPEEGGEDAEESASLETKSLLGTETDIEISANSEVRDAEDLGKDVEESICHEDIKDTKTNVEEGCKSTANEKARDTNSAGEDREESAKVDSTVDVGETEGQSKTEVSGETEEASDSLSPLLDSKGQLKRDLSVDGTSEDSENLLDEEYDFDDIDEALAADNSGTGTEGKEEPSQDHHTDDAVCFGSKDSGLQEGLPGKDLEGSKGDASSYGSRDSGLQDSISTKETDSGQGDTASMQSRDSGAGVEDPASSTGEDGTSEKPAQGAEGESLDLESKLDKLVSQDSSAKETPAKGKQGHKKSKRFNMFKKIFK